MGKLYPEKRDINLAMREQPKHSPVKIAVGTLVVVLALLAVGKLAVWNVLDQVNAAQAAADQAESDLAQLRQRTEKYPEVQEEYQNYTLASSTMTGAVDPMDCLDLIKSHLVDRSQVESYAVADGLITVQMSGVTLREVSAIYADLMASDLVENVQVYTAATKEDSGERVIAAMTIQLKTETTDTTTEGEGAPQA